MRFALLGSGSEGNALVVQAGRTYVLLDCGFSLSETVARLSRLGISPESLNGIVVTHEHGDHIAGVAKLARKFSIPVWLSHGTLRAQSVAFAGIPVSEIDIHSKFAIGDMGSNSSPAFPSGTVNLIGGTVAYTSDRPAGFATSQMRLTAVGTYNGYQVTISAVLQYTGVKWVTQRVYQNPDAVEYSRLN